MCSDPFGKLPDMVRETYDLVAQVPEGCVTTYGKVAEALGDVVASRFVGLAMSMNDDIIRVPCRRVVQSDGFVGGYTGGGPEKKARLLREEGLRVVRGRVQNLESVLFTDFRSSYPLKALRQRQISLRRQVSLRPLRSGIAEVAGIDVAYEGDRAWAAAAVFDYDTQEELDRFVVEDRVRFPYIPAYLAYRELPVVSGLIPKLSRGTVLIYDGNGTLHPEKFGVASHAAVAFGMPTIGAAKKLLCGTVIGRLTAESNPVRLDGQTLGYRLSGGRSRKAVYVSPGSGLSVSQSLDIVRRFQRYRIPEPTRIAHQVAEQARRATSHK